MSQHGFTIKNKNLQSLDKILIPSAVVKNDELSTSYITFNQLSGQHIHSLSSIERDYSTLLYGTNNSNDDVFSIRLIQYYDDTNYLNIESKMPSTLIESKIIDYVSGVEFSLNENNLIVSAQVKNPVYENVYIPCSNFISNYNEKFWKSNTLILNSKLNSTTTNQSNYLNIYQKFDQNLYKCSIDVYKENYINETLKPLFNKIWDTFALSSVTEEQLETQQGILYKQYIGNGLGKNNLLNNANKIFPTIAAFQNVDGLIQIDQYDKENILFVAKYYYQNVFQKVKNATIKMLKMYNEDGTPINGWKKQYLTFHGYANNYQSSDNKLPFSLKQNKLYKNNGPFVYQKLQEFLYNHYNSKKTNIKNFMKDYCVIQSYPIISSYYQYYLNQAPFEVYIGQNSIQTYKIKNYEEDKLNNCFTLFKKQHQNFGKVFFRSFKMPLSVPIMNGELSILQFKNDDSNYYKNIFEKVFNNCFDFGILNDTFWLFGKFQNAYKLLSFKFSDNLNGTLLVDSNTIIDYVYGSDTKLFYLNDFVGTYSSYNNIDFILFNTEECLKTLGECQTQQQKIKMLTNFDLVLEKISLNVISNTYSKKYLKHQFNEKNSLIPMILSHSINFNQQVSGKIENKIFTCEILNSDIKGIVSGSFKEINNDLQLQDVIISSTIGFANSQNISKKSFNKTIDGTSIFGVFNAIINTSQQRIWKLDKNNENCFISYKSVNGNIQDGTFDYYFNFNPNIIKVETFNAQWDQQQSYVDIGDQGKSHIMTFNFEKDSSILITALNKLNYKENNFNNLSQNQKDQIYLTSKKLNDLTTCELNNAKIKSKISAFNIGYQYTDEFSNLLTFLIIKKAKQYINGTSKTYLLSFNQMQKILKSQPVSLYAKTNSLFKNNSIYFTYYDLIYSYQSASNIYSTVKQHGIYQVKRKQSSYSGKYSSIFDQTNEFFKRIPALSNCCIQPLNVKLVFKNNSGITFLNDGVIDLDMGCYINDRIQKNKIVGYWQGYKNTSYIKWGGDETNGGYQEVNIDIQKYILNHPITSVKQDKNCVQICFNACWNQNSQILPENIFIMIKWNHLIEKYPITLIGESTKGCNVKSFSIFIDKLTKEITIDQNVLYPVLKLNYKKQPNGCNGVPDIQMGTISLNQNQLKNLSYNDWFKYSKDLYYKKQAKDIMYLFTNKNFTMNYKYDEMIKSTYHTILKNNIYIEQQQKVYSIDQLTANDCYLKNGYEDQNINWNYVQYLSPTHFNKVFKDLNYKIEGALHGDLLTIYQSQGIIEKVDIIELSQPALERIYTDVKKIQLKVESYPSDKAYMTQQQKQEINNIKIYLEKLKQEADSIQFDQQPLQLIVIKNKINNLLKTLKD